MGSRRMPVAVVATVVALGCASAPAQAQSTGNAIDAIDGLKICFVLNASMKVDR